MFDVSRTTIYSIKNGKEIKQRGPKSKSDNKQFILQVKRAIRKLKKSKKRVTSSQIHQNLPAAPSLSTVQRCLKNNKEFSLRSMKRKLKLTEVQKRDRVSLIKQWFREKVAFEKVIFTDEVRFSLDGSDNCLSWELDDENNDCIRQLRQQKGGSIMCYMALTKYNDDFILQQDNASAHKSKATAKFLKDSKVEVLNWPSRSPDMSLIENIFKSLKDLVYGTEDYTTKKDLWAEIGKCVAFINESKVDMIKHLYDNITDRFLNVILKQGDN